MANINLSPGERYTFAKLQGSSVITDSTDHAQSAQYIRNDLYVTSSTAQLFVKTGAGAGNAVTTTQVTGTGDPIVQLSVGTTTAENWSIGIDNSDSDILKIHNGTTIGSAVTLAMQIDTNKTASFAGSLLVTGSVIIPGSTIPIDTSWTSYTPVWTTDGGTQPVIGNGSIVGAYKQIGKTVFVRVKLSYGTTTTSGTGAFYFGLPVTASIAYGVQFPCSILDNGNAWYQGTVNGEYGGFTYKTAIIGQSSGANSSQGVTGTFPFTFGSADSIQFNGSYEAS